MQENLTKDEQRAVHTLGRVHLEALRTGCVSVMRRRSRRVPPAPPQRSSHSTTTESHSHAQPQAAGTRQQPPRPPLGHDPLDRAARPISVRESQRNVSLHQSTNYLVEEGRNVHDEEGGHRRCELAEHSDGGVAARLVLEPLEAALDLELHELETEARGVRLGQVPCAALRRRTDSCERTNSVCCAGYDSGIC